MKKIFLLMIFVVSLYGWETTTHRAIDKTAIESKAAVNLKKFVEAASIENEKYKDEKFEGYGLTYFEYFDKDKSSDAMAKWNQTFNNNYNYQDLIEAGTMLEDAQWPYALNAGDGRFNNHFYNPQNSGSGLNIGIAQFQNALQWAQTGASSDTSYAIGPFHPQDNRYSLDLALEYFKLGFTHSLLTERRRYQAKMKKSQRLLVKSKELKVKSRGVV